MFYIHFMIYACYALYFMFCIYIMYALYLSLIIYNYVIIIIIIQSPLHVSPWLYILMRVIGAIYFQSLLLSFI
jgi:hypothetical protein